MLEELATRNIVANICKLLCVVNFCGFLENREHINGATGNAVGTFEQTKNPELRMM